MNEIQAIVALAQEAEVGEPMAMATVVKVRGSAYRRPGARMLLTASGRTAGMISGGCLEGDVRERARKVMETGQARVVTYDSTMPEDIVFGLGLGCNGIVQVLIEPLKAGDESGLLMFLTTCYEERQAGRAATVFQTEGTAASVVPGTRLFQWPDNRITTNADNANLVAPLMATLMEATMPDAVIRRVELQTGGSIEVLVETVSPPVSLMIFGAGDDAIPVAGFAKLLGWHVTVIDARPAYALPERFPAADAVYCIRPESLRDCPEIALTSASFAMIMTHNFLQDKEFLRTLLPLGASYVGLLGPKARTQRLIDELVGEGTTLSEECLARLHGPAGLDIGAETPEEVALSLLAEMQASKAMRPGGALRDRNAGIHDAIDAVSSSAL